MHTPKSSKLLELKIIRTIIIILLIPIFIVAIVSFLCSIFYRLGPSISWNIFQRLATNSDGFVGEDIGVIFSVLGTFLLIYTIIDQFIEKQKRWGTDIFYKMLEFHNNIVNQLSVTHIEKSKNKQKSNGRRAFVIFEIQISKLLEIIENLNKTKNWNILQREQIHIAYLFFYYGVDSQGTLTFHSELPIHNYKNIKSIIENRINKLKHSVKLGRTNCTSLSSYLQNMYNTIKLVDTDKYLSNQEKENLFTIYRAQLSTAEQYVLSFCQHPWLMDNKDDNREYNPFEKLLQDYNG